MNSNTTSEWSDSVLKPWSWMIMICFVDFNRLFGCMILDWPFLTFQTFHRVAVQHPAFTTCCAKPLGTLAYGCSSNIFLCSPTSKLPENILIHMAAILHDLAQVNICKPTLFHVRRILTSCNFDSQFLHLGLVEFQSDHQARAANLRPESVGGSHEYLRRSYGYVSRWSRTVETPPEWLLDAALANAVNFFALPTFAKGHPRKFHWENIASS